MRGPAARPKESLPTRAALPGSGSPPSTRPRRSNVVIAPGLLFSAKDYRGLRARLLALGHPRVETLPVSSWEWAPSLLLGAPFTWYLDKLDRLARDLADEGVVSVVGHSAGGWLARIWLASEVYNGKAYRAGSLDVEALVTLGTPHLSVEEYPFGRVRERRRGEKAAMSEKARGSSLCFANEFASAEAIGVKVVSVAGKSAEANGSWFARASYRATCRRGDVVGDGVTPVESALLSGADHLVLDGVTHGPSTPMWYGDDKVVEKWDALLL